ncbi:hypothetical protein ACLB2K_048918 [Fragaria x ananassa]
MALPPSPKRRRKDESNETAAKSPQKSSPVVVFAHGAGAPSSSDWMIRWKDMLGKALNAVEVVTFDYPYSQLEELVKEFPPLKVKDLPTIKTKQNPEQFFQMTASRLIDEANASHGVIINTFEEIEGKALIRLRDELSAPIFGVGPFHKPFPTIGSSGPGCTLNLPQDQSCISWLNTQAPNSVIYVGFGSLATLSEEQFLELAWGLANSNQPFLWVVRSEFVQGSKWLEALPDKLLETLYGKGHIVKWAPQKAVLAHPAVGAFWTHCGWNSTLGCISEGVPMICMPCSADQMINARYVSDVWKVGLQLDHGRERGEIEKTIRRLMVEKEGEEIRQNMSNLKEKADLCFKPGGSSYECLEGLVRHILLLEANCQRSTNSD